MNDLVFFLGITGIATAIKMVAKKLGINRKPFSCILCLSFWVALIVGPIVNQYGIMEWLMYAFASAGFSWALNKYITGEY